MTGISTPTIKLLHSIGRIIGVAAGSASCLLWTTAMWDPASGFALSPASHLVVFLMILIGILVVIASIKGNSTMLLVMFFVAFLPVGLYVIAIPHWIRWVGLANMGFLVAGLLLRLQPDGSDSENKKALTP